MSESFGSGTRALIAALLPGVEPAPTVFGRHKQLVYGLNAEPSTVWLLAAVLGRRLPTSAQVERWARVARFDGIANIIVELYRARVNPARWFDPAVEVIEGAVLMDVHDTATSRLGTGVQRVANAIVHHWLPRRALIVGWTPSRGQLRLILPEVWRRPDARKRVSRRAIVPWRGWYALAEVVADAERSKRIQAIAQYSSGRSMLVGLDAIPLTTAETTGVGMPGVFAKYLAAASRMNIVACISDAAATEYRGWRDTLGSAGIPGPEITTVRLPGESARPAEHARTAAIKRFTVTDSVGPLPLLLCVGSHEPRKNHLAVVHAAEVLWREGRRFALIFVGGNAWASAGFTARVTELKKAGRPIVVYSGVSDAELAWGYELAFATVFPSLNEGFGLPIVESLAAGTPVVTSNFGSMAELAREGGCVLVDPRDDASVTAGMRAVLSDPQLHSRLVTEARARPIDSWADYADRLWRVLVG